MTTFSYTIELDDSERITLDAALAMLKDACELQIAAKTEAPAHAHLRNIASVQNKLTNGGHQVSGSTFQGMTTPQSEFFTARLTDRGELPWFEIRALASIGAGLLMRHLGDRAAIDKLAGYKPEEMDRLLAKIKGVEK